MCYWNRYPREIRRNIVKRQKDGCAPLFFSCKRGNAEIAEYLLTVCDADIEQRGMFEVPEDRSIHCVTPLVIHFEQYNFSTLC